MSIDRQRGAGGDQAEAVAKQQLPTKPAYRFDGEVPTALAHLRDKPRWVAWNYRPKGGKWTKPPIDPHSGRAASVSNPRTWGTLDEALAAMQRYRLAGVGLMLIKEGGLSGVDLDHCVTDSDSLSPLAAEIVGYAESYAEYSPSGEGIRLFVSDDVARALKDDGTGVEIYGHGRYLTVTGRHIDGTPTEVRPALRTLARLRAAVDAAREAKRSTSNGTKSNSSAVNDHVHAGGSDFFHNLNGAALAKLDAWVPMLHPSARKFPNGAWRVSSKNLGRSDLEEDLSYHPNGIGDFGEEHGLTPVDAVMRYGEAVDAKAAADWLCQQLGIEPASLGWRGRKNAATSGDKAPRREGQSDDTKRGKEGHQSQAQVLIEIATGDDVELFHSPDGMTYADIRVSGHRETWPTKSRSFQRWLRRSFYERTGGAPNSEAMSAAMQLIEARAQFDGDTRLVYVRVAAHGDTVYIDMGDPQWRAIEIDADGWRIMNEPPVRFRRSPGMLALPEPVLGGNISELRKHLNLSDDGFILCVGWLLSALSGRGPYPLLALAGEQGTGKSTGAEKLRRLVDPNSAPLRGLPKDVRDLAISANNSHVLAFDNLSGIPADIADALCRLSTGGGFSTRALYSDDEERIFEGQRPVITTSINDVAIRPDLANRTLVVPLETIAAKDRKTDAEVREEFERAAPYILGALVTVVANGLKRETSEVRKRMNRLPRMADHAFWIRACEPIDTIVDELQGTRWTEGRHLEVYDRSQEEAVDIVLESDPVAAALRAYMDVHREINITSTTLLEVLGSKVTDAVRRSREWPPNARALSNRLRKLAPALRSIGFTITFMRTGHERTREILIRRQQPDERLMSGE